MARRKHPPSPWLRDIRWGPWLFFIGVSAVSAALNILAVKDATIMDVMRAIASSMGITGAAFAMNAKDLPWLEKGQKAVPETATVIEGEKTEEVG